MRRGFTLMETMLATGIASIVVLACLALMFAMNRTDRNMALRAQQRSDLGRIRTVMSRAMSSLLLSDEPNKSANPADDDSIFDGRPMTGAASRQPARPGQPTTAANKPANDKNGTSGKDGQAQDGGDNAAAEGSPDERAEGKGAQVAKPPPPPRIILGVDQRVDDVMRFHLTPDEPEVQAGVQRLEIVLHRSPVPTAKIDPMDMPLPPRSSHQRSRAAREDAQANADDGTPATVASATEGSATDADSIAPEEEAALPVRAIRGAFELRPQPPAGYRAPGIPTIPAAPDDRGFQRTGLWELWWIPLLPPGSTSQALTRDEALFSGAQQPCFIAGNLKYAHWTVFFRRTKRPDLVTTWRSELPAYIEFQVETSAGLQANWMFEVDWAEGPEIARPPEETVKGGSGSGSGSNATAQGTPTGSDKAEGGTGRPRVNRPAVTSGGARPVPRPANRGGKGESPKGGAK